MRNGHKKYYTGKKLSDIDYISVAKGLASTLVTNNRQLKAVSILYQLKSLYVGGVVFDYRKQAQVIADSFGYSKRKLTDYIKILIEEKLATEEPNGNLLLRSSNYIASVFGLGKTGFHKILKSELANLETIFKGLAIEENLKQQEYNLESKIVKKAINESLDSKKKACATNKVGTIKPEKMTKAAYARERKAVMSELPALILNEKKLYIDAISKLDNSKKDIMPFVTLTRKGVAKVVNRVSKSTGHRLVKKLVKLGYMKDDNDNNIYLGTYSYEEYNAILDTVNYDYSYTFTRSGTNEGKLVKVMPNNIGSTNFYYSLK